MPAGRGQPLNTAGKTTLFRFRKRAALAGKAGTAQLAEHPNVHTMVKWEMAPKLFCCFASLLFSLIMRRSSFTESALRSASS